MSTKFQIKRSSVSGKTPNTTNISPGELAINLTDQKLYSSNGTAIFEIGAASDTSRYLEVANAAFVVGNNTTQYLEVANAVGLIQENTNQFLAVANATVYLEVANVSQYIPANTSISTVAYESTNTTLTVTTEDGRNLDADLSGLVDEVRANTSISNVAFTSANNNLKIQTEHGTVFSVDLSPLVVSTTEYLEVANAAPLIANQTTHFLEVANAEPLIANLTTKYLEVANTVYNYKTTFNYTATAGQKEFTGTDLNGQVLDYYGNTAEVFLNGIKQIKGTDWYANTDSIVTLSIGAGVNDTVEIVSVNAITEFVSAPDLTSYIVQSELDAYLQVANVESVTSQYMQVANLAQVATTGNYSHLTGTPSLATVATTGSYNDLSGTPTIPSTDPFLQVANAVPLIQENTSKYLEVANVVATDTSAYLEKANASIYLEVANLAAETSKYLEKANASIYLEVANVAANTSTSSAAISGNTATFTRADGSTFTLDVSTLYDRYVTASATSGNNLTITLNDGSTVTVDLGPLVAGAANNLYVQAGAVSGNTLTLTLNDASTVDIDVSSLSDPTTQYLEVANASVYMEVANLANVATTGSYNDLTDQPTEFLQVANLAPATSKYLEKANASIYLEVANVVITNTDPYLEVANLAPATSKYLEKANASIYLEVANVVATNTDPYLEVANLTNLASDITPDNNNIRNIGAYGKEFGVIYANTIVYRSAHVGSGGGSISFPDITVTMVPDYDNLHSIGSSSKRWRDLYLSGTVSENGERLASNTYVQRYLEVANVVTTNTDPYLEVANASVYAEMANVVPKTGGEFTGSTQVRGEFIVGYPNTAPAIISYGNVFARRYYENGARMASNSYVQLELDRYLLVANVAANTSTASAAISGNTATFTRDDGSTFTLDVSTLYDRYITGSSTSGNNLTMTLNDGSTVTVDLGPLVAGAANNLYVQSGAVSGNTLTLTLNDASTVAIDVASLNDMTNYLEVANAAPLIANLTTKYLEVANVSYNYKTTFNYTATAGQKEFTGTDLNGQTLDYYGNTAEVFLNGVKQIKGTDWYANTDSIVTLSVGAGVNDTVEIVSVNAITQFVSAPDLTSYVVQSELSPYLQVANVSSFTSQYMQVANLAQVATTGNYSHLTGTPSLATVATTGSYNDLSGTPTIPTTTEYLQVANAVPLIQQNTSKYLEVANAGGSTTEYLQVANAAPLVANLTTKYLEVANVSSSNVVDDTTPQLGGNLDLNDYNIIGNGNITITGNTSITGDTTITGNTAITGDTTITGNTNVERLETSSAANSGVYFGNSYFITAEQTEAITTSTNSATIAYGRYDEAAIEFMVLVTDTVTRERQYSKILFIHEFAAYANGDYHYSRRSFMNEYSKIYTGNNVLSTFEIRYDYDGAMDYNEYTMASQTPDEYNIQLKAKPTSTNRMKFKVTRTGMRDSL